MLCEICNQNEATVHYTEVINGVKNERHLCSECMKELEGDAEFPFANLIRGILSSHLTSNQSGREGLQLKCSKCGMTYREFTKVGKFGCAECYSVFGPLILDNIKRIQGSDMHEGKRYTKKTQEDISDLFEKNNSSCSAVSSQNEIEILQCKLNKAVAIEDFDEAARLRDLIKKQKEVEKHA